MLRIIFSIILRRQFYLGLALCMAIMLPSGNSSYAQQIDPEWDEWDVIPGKVLIKYKAGRSKRIKALQATSGITGLSVGHIEKAVKKRFQKKFPTKKFISILPDTFVGQFAPALRTQVLQALAADPDVDFFEPDRVRVPKTNWGTSTPNDPYLSSLWGMNRIGAPAGWERQSATRSTIRACVMEERYDDSHQDLTAQHSSVQNNSEPISDHATHVAGTIAATGNNGLDVVGVANVELVSLAWPISSSDFINKISWAVNNGVDVINMSWHFCRDANCNPCEYSAPSSSVQNAITNALGDIVFVASAGNDSCNTDEIGRVPLPVGYSGVIGISALTSNDTQASFSNYGSYVDLTAPGVSIRSTIPTNTTVNKSGTSMSAPHVSGSVAAVLAVAPTFHVRSVTRLLELTAEDLGATGRDDIFGHGVVRLDKAIDAIADNYAESGTSCGSGTLYDPHCALADALTSVPTDGKIGLVSGSFDESLTIAKSVTITSIGGAAIIGK